MNPQYMQTQQAEYGPPGGGYQSYPPPQQGFPQQPWNPPNPTQLSPTQPPSQQRFHAPPTQSNFPPQSNFPGIGFGLFFVYECSFRCRPKVGVVCM